MLIYIYLNLCFFLNQSVATCLTICIFILSAANSGDWCKSYTWTVDFLLCRSYYTNINSHFAVHLELSLNTHWGWVSEHHIGSDSNPERFLFLHFYFLYIPGLHNKIKERVPSNRILISPQTKTDAIVAILLCFHAGQMMFLLLPMGMLGSVVYQGWVCHCCTEQPSRRTRQILSGSCWSQWCTQSSTNLTVDMAMLTAC